MKQFILFAAITFSIVACNNNSTTTDTRSDTTKVSDTVTKDSTNPASAPVQNAPY